MRSIFILLLFIPALYYGVSVVDDLHYCCSLGSDWIEKNTQCDNVPTPVSGVNPENQFTCITALGFCCRKKLYVRSCDAGKTAAKQGQECLAIQEEAGGDYHRDCCDCCKLGITLGGMGMSCDLKKLGSPCDDIFLECCLFVSAQKPERPSQIENDDIDECQAFPNQLCAQVCTNTPESFYCSCKEGFRLHPNGRSCMLDTTSDRCRTNNPCAHECRDTGVAIQCSCQDGYRLLEDKQNCEDIDECILGTDSCDRHKQVCQNIAGSFRCEPRETSLCPPGFKTSSSGQCEDINECTEGLHECDPVLEYCLNTIGQFECHLRTPGCPAGYKQNPITRTCEDVDECAEGSHNCDREKDICINKQGSFSCQGAKPIGPRPCSKGYRYNHELKICNDIDECDDEEDDCDHDRENCINTPGSFKCEPLHNVHNCPSGFRFYENRGCIDIDECAEGADNCDKNTEKCTNSPGSFACHDANRPSAQCSPGTRYNFDLRRCVDIDECQENLHSCILETEDCVNTPGSFTCLAKVQQTLTCSSGYRYSRESRTCVDIDECSEAFNDCQPATQRCINTIGGYQCQSKPQEIGRKCSQGLRFNYESRACQDIDECLENTHNCHQEHYYCINNVGSFYCRCSDGFQYNSGTQRCEDINECILGRDTCRIGQRCENTIGSFTCSRELSCGTGYTLNRDSGHCEDDDECKLGTHNCGVAYSCRNTAGSFRCDVKTCPQGYRLNPHTGACDRVECGEGMEPDNFGQCIDINECLEANVCRRNQRCINMIGSYRCQSLLNCGGGYEVSEDGSQCVDIDECAKNTHNCPGGQMCFNRPGGYVCQCPQGYVINRSTRQCEDIDECTRFANTVCPSNAECQNSQGSYRCNCKEGFRNADDGRNCIDINECERNPCQHQCLNLWGSYQCSCESGYQLRSDNRSCQDIDECSIWAGRGRLCIGQCVNEPGSYSCSCPSGYTLQQDKRTCQDIDECKQNQCQGENEICLNTRGGYKCYTIHCPPQYVRDTEHKNRCKRSTLVCSQGDMECLKAPISISYSYLTFHSELSIPPSGQIDLFTMRGPLWSTTSAQFELKLNSARAPQGIQPATRESFSMRRSSFNQAVISLNQQLKGPQEIELELQMKLYHNGMYGGVAVSYIYIYVSQYNF